MSVSKETPPSLVRPEQTLSPPDCGRLLWTALTMLCFFRTFPIIFLTKSFEKFGAVQIQKNQILVILV